MYCVQWCIAKNEGGYTQTGVEKGLKVPCLFMITEVSIRSQKKPGGWYTPYTPKYTIDCVPLLKIEGASQNMVITYSFKRRNIT